MKINSTKIPRALLIIVVALFLGKSLDYIVRHGDRLHDQDTGSEDNTITAARNFVSDGWVNSCGLPKYGRYNLDSASKPIAESDYYTHYFPGPDYVLYATSAVFGPTMTTAQWTRLMPLLHFLAAVVFFLLFAHKKLWPHLPIATPLVAAFVLFAPANRNWILNLHGHGYVSSYTIAAFALGVLGAGLDWKRQRERTTLIISFLAAFALGFASNYMLLTNAFVVCAAPLIGGLLVSNASLRLPFLLSFTVGLGLVGAFVTHFWQIACLFSWKDAIADQLGTLTARVQKAHGATPTATRVQLIGQYSNQVFGFFGLSSIAMLVLGLFLTAIANVPAILKKRWTTAMVLATVAAYAWVFALPSHASGHFHVNPRIFLLQWICFLIIAALCAQSLRKK